MIVLHVLNKMNFYRIFFFNTSFSSKTYNNIIAFDCLLFVCSKSLLAERSFVVLYLFIYVCVNKWLKRQKMAEQA